MEKDEQTAQKRQEESLKKAKEKGFGTRERLSLKHNALESDLYRQEKEKNNKKKLKMKEKKLPVGLAKMRSKIREVYDEEDESEDYLAHVKQPKDEDLTLFEALTESEKKALKQKEATDTVRKQQDVGKMEALTVAHNFAKEAGEKGLNKKMVASEMQNALFEPQNTQERVVEKTVSKKLGIRGKIEQGKIIQAARGIKKIEQFGTKKSIKNLDSKDIIKVGEDKIDEQKLAKLILEKSGQNVQKRKTHLKTNDEVPLKHLKVKTPSDKQKEEKKNEQPLFKESNNFGR